MCKTCITHKVTGIFAENPVPDVAHGNKAGKPPLAIFLFDRRGKALSTKGLASIVYRLSIVLELLSAFVADNITATQQPYSTLLQSNFSICITRDVSDHA